MTFLESRKFVKVVRYDKEKKEKKKTAAKTLSNEEP